MHGILSSQSNTASRKLRIALRFSLIDALSPLLVLLFYLTEIDLVSLVNVNFLLLTAYMSFNYRAHTSSVFLSYLLFGAAILSIFKIIIAGYTNQDLMLTHILSYSYGIIMPIAALSFGKTVSEAGYDNVHKILCEFSLRYLYISAPIVLIYSILYFTGQVFYFGLGINFHYIYPFFLTGKILPIGIFLFLILLSGKRSVFINYLVQTVTFYGISLKGNLIKTLFLIFGLTVLIYLISIYTSLLDRFSWIFSDEFDISDPYFLLIAAGGRFEEVMGIQSYFQTHPIHVFFGSPPGAYYIWAVQLSEYSATKNYSHVTVFGYIFRYGLIFALPFYVYCLWQILRHLGSRCPFYILFVGIFSSSLFGANLVIDPTSWMMIGIFLALNRSKADRYAS